MDTGAPSAEGAPTDGSASDTRTCDRLDSWKEIGAYLKRDVRTLRRWEKEQGLPVHRHVHKKLGSVYAFKAEIDAWWNNGRQRTETPPVPRLPPFALAAAGLLAIAAVALAAFAWWSGTRATSSSDITTRQLTFQSAERPVFTGALSPDGKYLAYVDAEGLAVQTMANDDVRRVAMPPAVATVGDLGWLADSTTLILAAANGVWRTSVFGDQPRKIAEGAGLIAVSPDGRRLALREDARSRILVMTTGGEDLREVVPPEPGVAVGRPSWAPDGRRFAYGRRWLQGRTRRIVIETRLADGTDPTVVAEVPSLANLVWTPDGRIIFGQKQAPPDGRFEDLWEVRVDTVSGRPFGDPVRIFHGPDLNFRLPGLSSGGLQLVFTVSRLVSEVDVADFDPERLALGEPRRAVFTNSWSEPSSWSPAGDAILYGADLDGYPVTFRQRMNSRESERLTPHTGRDAPQVLIAPGSGALLYVWARQPGGLMKVPVAGGQPEKVLDIVSTEARVDCAQPPSTVCVLADVVEGRLSLTSFDAVTGLAKRHAPQFVPTNTVAWDVSRDGREVVLFDPTGARPALLVVHIATDRTERVETEALARAHGGVAWTASGRGWIVTRQWGNRGGDAVHIDRAGKSTLLWKSDYRVLRWPVVSPDGRRIAFGLGYAESNIWMLEGF